MRFRLFYCGECFGTRLSVIQCLGGRYSVYYLYIDALFLYYESDRNIVLVLFFYQESEFEVTILYIFFIETESQQEQDNITLL